MNNSVNNLQYWLMQQQLSANAANNSLNTSSSKPVVNGNNSSASLPPTAALSSTYSNASNASNFSNVSNSSLPSIGDLNLSAPLPTIHSTQASETSQTLHTFQSLQSLQSLHSLQNFTPSKSVGVQHAQISQQAPNSQHVQQMHQTPQPQQMQHAQGAYNTFNVSVPHHNNQNNLTLNILNNHHNHNLNSSATSSPILTSNIMSSMPNIGALQSLSNMSTISNGSIPSIPPVPGMSSIPQIHATPMLNSLQSMQSRQAASSAPNAVNGAGAASASVAAVLAAARGVSVEAKQEEEGAQAGVTTHYLWRCGVWTTSENDSCAQAKQSGRGGINSLMAPMMRVIEPNTMSNVNVLSYFNDYKKNFRGKKGRCKKIGEFKNYIFFSKKCTYSLEKMIDTKSSLIDVSRIYQFESRHFQYSLLQGKITFIQTDIESDHPKEYLIFRFAHHSKYSDNSPLYGVAAPNVSIDSKHPNYQPWQCTDIVTESNILGYFNLHNASEQAKLDFLSYLPKPLTCHQHQFRPELGFDPNFERIGRLLSKGSSRYNKDKAIQSTSNPHGPHNMGHMGGHMGHMSHHSGGDGYGSDNVSVCSDSSHASMRSFGSSVSNCSTKSSKIKNEDKFRFLNDICNVLGVGFYELIDRILDAIQEAFDYATKHPESVLTQAYIDEEKCRIYYEAVILAEIRDEKHRGRTWKFGVPIVNGLEKDDMQQFGSKMEDVRDVRYVARNILTPQMAIENIMLNTPDIKYEPKSWIARMWDWQSYQKPSNGSNRRGGKQEVSRVPSVSSPTGEHEVRPPYLTKKSIELWNQQPPKLNSRRRSVEIL